MMGTVMRSSELERMDLNSLWTLHTELREVLARKISAEKETLEERLRHVESRPARRSVKRGPERRPYPPVFPQYCNPDEPTQTWAGRGKQPRWLVNQLKSGRMVDEFRIVQAAE